MEESVELMVASLRRYALALTGDPGEGDRLVEETLRQAPAEVPDPDQAGNLGLYLLTLLHQLRAHSTKPARPDGPGGSAWAPLQKLSERERAALLLVTQFGLSYRQVGSVLGLPRDTVAQNLISARARLAIQDFEPGARQKDTREGEG